LFYRLSLNKGNELIELKDEIAQAKAYVSIQKIRYEDSFDAYFEIDPRIERAKIIKLIIQPFIENAIKHGFDENTTGSIYVTAKLVEDTIVIRVIDNGKGMESKKAALLLQGPAAGQDAGYGIKNVNDRIKIHYGEQFGVEISSEPQDGTIVEIKIPFIRE
jgi:sensor histidine kinase YesM